MGPELMPVLAGSALRVALLLAGAWAAAALMRRASAATRHLLWSCALAAAALAPAAPTVVPQWRLAAPAALASWATTSAPDEGGADEVGVTGGRRGVASANPSPPGILPGAASSPVDAESLTTLSAIAAIVWAVGLAGVGAWFLAAYASAWRLRWRAVPVDMAVVAGIPVRESAQVTTPIVCGLWRPTIVVPLGATHWPQARLRVVMLHELAHVRRRDGLTQALAQVLCAAYWFNPLVWAAAHRLRVERERACDDEVLRNGTRSSDYADHLVAIARAMHSGVVPAAARAGLAMAHRSQLEGRLMAILDPAVTRSSGGGTRLAAIATVLAISVPIMAAQPRLPANGTWEGNVWRWNGAVAAGRTIRVYGAGSSIRATASPDGDVHVEARRREGADVPVRLVRGDGGVVICFDGCASDQPSTKRWNDGILRRLTGGREPNVDVLVRVPAGVDFSGGSVAGDIDVVSLGGEVGVNTVDGDVTIRMANFDTSVLTVEGDVFIDVARGAGVAFSANTISGTIESELPFTLRSGARRGRAARGRFVAPLPPPPPDPPGNGVLPRPPQPPQAVSGTLGEGGPSLHVQTIEGDIVVRQR